jgi:hypothetical protein
MPESTSPISEKSNTFVVAPVEYENTGFTDVEAGELGNPRTMKRLTRAAALQMQLIWSGIVIGFLSALIGLTLSNTTAAVAGSPHRGSAVHGRRCLRTIAEEAQVTS